VRVAALYDIHGNVAALDAVLAELARARVDGVVVGGDVASGPFPVETLERLRALDVPSWFVRGNGDRELVEAFDAARPFAPSGEPTWDDAAAWVAQRLRREHRDVLAAFAPTVTLDVDGLGSTLFCHATARSDDELVTSLTPVHVLRRVLAGVRETVLVCGHTHSQYRRRVGELELVNAGSVGMPYEDAPGAYWAVLGGGVELRRTEYDLRAAAAAVRASGFPLARFADEHVLTVPARHEAEAVFEERRRAAAGD
jgi:predicted phosphodiesterase